MLGILEADLARDFAERAGGDPVRGESAHKAKPITQIDTLPMRTTDSDCKSRRAGAAVRRFPRTSGGRACRRCVRRRPGDGVNPAVWTKSVNLGSAATTTER